MKVLIIGYGSIGQRHARLLQELKAEVAVVSRRDVTASRSYKTIPAALADGHPDYVVIASSTNEHAADLEALAEACFKGAVLVEKPLFGTVRKLPDNDFRSLHVAYNLRFHPVLQAFSQAVGERPILSFSAHTGQYLPDWRPDLDYRKSYSAHRAAGGGVLRDLSHELDYMTSVCGSWRRVAALGGRFSTLEIDSDDIFSLLVETERCPVVNVHVNYLQDRPQREMIAITDTGTVRADLIANTVTVGDDVKHFNVGRDESYLGQHKAMLKSNDEFLCSANQGLEIETLIAAVEQAAREARWVGCNEAKT